MTRKKERVCSTRGKTYSEEKEDEDAATRSPTLRRHRPASPPERDRAAQRGRRDAAGNPGDERRRGRLLEGGNHRRRPPRGVIEGCCSYYWAVDLLEELGRRSILRTRSINALTALVRSVDLGLDAPRPLSKSQISAIARWRTRNEDLGLATARAESIRLARRIISAEEELGRNKMDLAELVAASGSAQLLNEVGIGAVNAAVILVAWSHGGRIRSEAAFASLSGTCPIPASSGNTERHRLNRGGDRRLNRALSSIALTRMSHDPETRAYVERRKSDGKTPKEIRRLLKRYIARQVFAHGSTNI